MAEGETAAIVNRSTRIDPFTEPSQVYLFTKRQLFRLVQVKALADAKKKKQLNSTNSFWGG